MSLASEGRTGAMMKEVERIVDAATRRDGDALGKACFAHVEAAGAAVMSQMSAGEEASKRTTQT